MFDTEDGDRDAGDDDQDRPGEPDPSTHDPEDYAPESDLGDPERDLVDVPEPPSVDAPEPPSVDVPEPPSVLPESEVPKDLLRGFWELVLVFNVALLSFSLGLMFVGFERRWRLGGALVALGLLSFYRGYRRYQRFEGDDSLSSGNASE